MEPKHKILFICRHNSGRSQMAEAYLREFAGVHFHVESAGLEPAETVNPLVVAVMKEEGFDLSASICGDTGQKGYFDTKVGAHV
jgi:arsenate reductase